jgi:uncharacterized protein (TIGR03118 family)
MRKLAIALALSGATVLGVVACGGGSGNMNSGIPTPGQFKAAILVSDGSVSAPHTDPNLKNGWGVVFNPTGFVWVSDNATQKSTLYDGNGVPQSLVVTIPPAGSRQPAGPTGIVFNSSTDFQVTANNLTGSAVFLWATDAGTIAGWSPKVLPTAAVNAYDDGAGGAVYKGLALSQNNGNNVLYAADFHNGKVDIFNATFNKIQLQGTFTDPTLPAGMAPFGIQAIGSLIYVTFAVRGPDGRTQTNGPGNGVVDAFDSDGRLVRRIAAGGVLNSPWGVTMAPPNFGKFSGELLVGNFGDGTINAFDPSSGASLGPLTQADGSSIRQPGLWGMAFGNGVQNQPVNTLFFAAGPTPTTGVYGRIDVTQ